MRKVPKSYLIGFVLLMFIDLTLGSIATFSVCAISFGDKTTGTTPVTVIMPETKVPQYYLEEESPKTTTIYAISSPIDEHDSINGHVRKVCSLYNNKVSPELVASIIKHESDYNPKETTGNCVGLMQVSTYWQAERAKKLGVTDFYDPYGNILIGVDYLVELTNTYKDPKLVLMLYNMKHDTAFKMYREGKVSRYAKSVLAKAEDYQKGE